jgi:hypothetical protein
MHYPHPAKNLKNILSGTQRIHTRSGVTLISTLISIAIILIALIGTINFRYYATMDARKAVAQTTASRIALLLCENWRGINGDTGYNPAAYLGSDIKLTQSEGPSEPDDFTSLGSYKIVLDEEDDGAEGADYFVTLSWKDIQPGLRALNVVVSWAQRGQRGLENTDKSFRLTTYVTTL